MTRSTSRSYRRRACPPHAAARAPCVRHVRWRQPRGWRCDRFARRSHLGTARAGRRSRTHSSVYRLPGSTPRHWERNRLPATSRVRIPRVSRSRSPVRGPCSSRAGVAGPWDERLPGSRRQTRACVCLPWHRPFRIPSRCSASRRCSMIPFPYALHLFS